MIKDFIKQRLKENLANIDEGKQIGPLYYFTRYGRLTKIIENNFIMTSTIQPFVSFTRNKNMKSDTISDDVRITIDGDMLSNKYKITPFAHTQAGYGRGVSDESEERIDLRKYPKGVDISKLILSIDINDPTRDFDPEDSYGPPSLTEFSTLVNLLRNKRIPFKFNKVNYQVSPITKKI